MIWALSTESIYVKFTKKINTKKINFITKYPHFPGVIMITAHVRIAHLLIIDQGVLVAFLIRSTQTVKLNHSVLMLLQKCITDIIEYSWESPHAVLKNT